MDIKKNFNLARRHSKFDQKVIGILKTQTNSEINSLSTKEARQVYNWNRQVASTYQRARAFARLKISKHGIVYGKIEPGHYVEDLVANWFLSRFPIFIIMIESQRGTFVISKDKELIVYKEKIEKLLPEFEKLQPENNILKDLEDFNDDMSEMLGISEHFKNTSKEDVFNEFWKKYYDSQFIKERKNRRYFLHNIPKKFHKWDSLELEKKRFEKNKVLTKFT